MSSPRDKDEAIINPFTGQLDFVRTFNPDRIISHTHSASGEEFFDSSEGPLNLMGPFIVFDSNGNVVTT